ncbi:Retrovirus-related Pol polyprotein from transposon TNT 1-94 [Vitis vinifera]|uniref:Retrovirus-related Pol polyprotein from transposon TNT 1-94 n=1 Tax=Vitis vinifera TaxID=29760 RepID=A0A438FL39_VITVI|nr:Retrovirus-related Pol polyprotein from transposon TNT 1-94 [Vitis vinifera]
MITSEKLVGSENYLSWSASMELGFMGQGYEDHLVTQEADIPEVDRVQWRKIDAQLCSVLWQSVDPKILLHLQAYKTCFKFWNQAKGLYTNDIQRLCKEEFLTVMPLTTNVGDQRTQIDKFFMVLTLIGFRLDHETVRDQILGSSSVPSLDDVFARLLRISSTQTLSSDNTSDSSVLLHGRPPRTAHVTQSSDPQPPQPPSSSTSQGISLTDSEYDDYLRYQATKSAAITSVAQTGNAFACLTHTSSLGPWILDSGTFDHISGNKDLFSSITTTSTLPTVTLANGSQTVAKGIGLAHPLPSLPLTSVLYTPETGVRGRESQSLYHHISPSTPAVCISTDAPLLIHSRLGHPSLSKFQKMVPRFSSLLSLACESCQLGKHIRVSFIKRLNNWAKSPFELVHTDVWGSCRTVSTLGFQYFVTFIDDYSRCTWLFLMKNRAELFSIFQKFYAEIQTQFNISIHVLRSDNVREYFSAPFTSFISQHGILHQSSCAYTPQQNGVAERKNRHLVETARILLLHSNVPFCFWGNVVLTTCYLINRMPSCVLHDQIPHSLLFPDQPLYFLPPRVFCCTCFVHILTLGQDKLSAKATKCIFLGYSRLQKGYHCYSSETHHYFLSADVTFFEDSPFFSTSESLPVPEVLSLPIISPLDAVPSGPLQVYHRRHRVAVPPSLVEVPADSFPIPLASPASALLTYPLLFGKSTPEALSHPGWRQAMVGPDGQVDRLKARLVAKGYTQVYGSDYGDTFSPVAKIAFVRLLLSMAAMRSWPLYQLAIKNVFLHGDLVEEVYMEQSLGFVAQGEFGLVCRLRRSLYSLKQFPRAWFSSFSSVVQEFDMLRSTTDHSVFYHHNSSGQSIYLVVYVDDIVITGSDQNGIQKLKQHLFTHFQTKDLGKLKYFLGIEIAQSSSGVVLSQRKYALDILEETDMLGCKPVDTPMDPNVRLIPG